MDLKEHTNLERNSAAEPTISEGESSTSTSNSHRMNLTLHLPLMSAFNVQLFSLI